MRKCFTNSFKGRLFYNSWVGCVLRQCLNRLIMEDCDYDNMNSGTPKITNTDNLSANFSQQLDSRAHKNVVYIYSENYLKQLAKLPKLPSRANAVHELINAYGLLSHVKIFSPEVASIQELKSFHSEEYIDYLHKLNDMNDEELDDSYDEAQQYGLGYDCPLIPHLLDFVCSIGGATLTAAKALVEGSCEIAVNWGGGWHHAKRDEAAGFCYVNDVVLGILHLLKKFQKVLYIDLDLHHGDGVEDAFAHTARVMCVSAHKYENGFYPGSGVLDDIGFGKGEFYTVNIPLCDGMQDTQYSELILPLLTRAYEKFHPEVVVCQCGADTLAGDPMESFNLTLKAPGECIKLLKSWKIPLMVLGGGGYNIANTSRCWTYLLSVLVEKELEPDIPDHRFLLAYGPDYELHISPRNLPCYNTEEDLKFVMDTIFDNLEEVK